MKKIVELIVNLEDIELEGTGVDAIALVENPAIQLDFLAFNSEEFVEPKSGESQDEFISRCIPVVIGEGYESDTAAAICYSYWETNKFAVNTGGLNPYVDQTEDLKKKETMSEEQEWILSECETMGEEYDPANSYFINAEAAKFSTLQDFLKGIAAIDILGKKKEEDNGETVFRYAGPSAERGFCKAMMRLNKVYRREEIQSLNDKNPGFGRNGSSTYSVFEYKGGPNCRHYWEQLTMFKQGNQTVFIQKGPVLNSPAGQSNNMNSPSSQGSVNNNAYIQPRNFSFNIDEDQRIVIGAAMIPNKMIKRLDENKNPYWVYFTEGTIKQIAEDYFEKYKQNNTNIEHNSDDTHTRNTLLESWIVLNPEKDKSSALGFDVPKGTWMVSYKINDDETWKQIKEGKLKGLSVEGYFISKAEAIQATKDTYKQILDILDNIEE